MGSVSQHSDLSLFLLDFHKVSSIVNSSFHEEFFFLSKDFGWKIAWLNVGMIDKVDLWHHNDEVTSRFLSSIFFILLFGTDIILSNGDFFEVWVILIVSGMLRTVNCFLHTGEFLNIQLAFFLFYAIFKILFINSLLSLVFQVIHVHFARKFFLLHDSWFSGALKQFLLIVSHAFIERKGKGL